MKYIDAYLLREKIAEQMESLPREVGRGTGTITSKGYGMMQAFQIMRSIIDSLQQEQPEVFDTLAFQKGVQEGRRLEREDIRQEIERRYAYQREMYNKTKPDGRPNDGWAESLAIMGELEELRTFLDSLSEEPVLANLEEAAEEYLQIVKAGFLRTLEHPTAKDCFKDGAEWAQKNFRKMYEELVESDWFKKNYKGKSMGEEQPEEDYDELDEAAQNIYKTPFGTRAEDFEAGAEWQYQKDRGEFAKLKAKEWCNGYDDAISQFVKIPYKPTDWYLTDEEYMCGAQFEEPIPADAELYYKTKLEENESKN